MAKSPGLERAEAASAAPLGRDVLAGLLESMPDAIVVVDHGGFILLANRQAEDLFGYGHTELIGQRIELLLPERLRATHTEARTAFQAKPRTRTMGQGLELRGRCKNGDEFPVEISLSPVASDEGTLILSAVRDVSERKRIEQALRDQNVELEKAARVKDQFLASMSHELRTPLNAIVGFTGTLLMRLPGPLNAAQERQLRTIQSSARHLHSLINDLLDLAKIEAGRVELELEAVRCDEVLAEVDALLRPAAQAKSLTFDVDTGPPGAIVTADRRALTQILLNLTTNAIKFTDSGEVTVSYVCSEPGPPRFVVTDTGIGIAAQDLPLLFQSFSQLAAQGAKRHEGAGLGLHLSRKLADLMGATIECESAPGRGSRFTLVFHGTAT